MYDTASSKYRLPPESTMIENGLHRSPWTKTEAPFGRTAVGIHQASSIRSVAAPRLLAISIASPVSPGLLNDHSALLGCSPEYFSRMAPLRENPPALMRTPPR